MKTIKIRQIHGDEIKELDLLVQDDMPMPIKGHGGVNSKYSPLAALKKSQCITFPDDLLGKGAFAWMKRHKMQPVSQTLKNGKVRVWRTK